MATDNEVTAAEAKADLDAAVVLISQAVGDAATEIRTLAAKLTASSGVISPGDIETTAAQLKTLAAGLEAVVSPPAESPAPAPVVAPAEEPISEFATVRAIEAAARADLNASEGVTEPVAEVEPA